MARGRSALRSEAVIPARGVLEAAADQLAAFKRPKVILFTKELPRNAMGKVQKNQLRDTHKNLFIAE